MVWTLIIVLLILGLLGAPVMPYYGGRGSSYGWGPSGLVGLIVVILLVLALTGRL